MRIVVTGGSGRLGRYVVEELKKFHEVTIFDIKEPKNDDVTFVRGDILNINDCRKAFKGADAIVHLAAIPHPLNDPPEKVFNVNVVGTFNVHQAAADLGIKKVVHASSDSSYGFSFRRQGDILFPAYLPLDENHPQRPADPYGLSKKIGEEIAVSFTRRYGMSTIALRICYVWFPENVQEYRPCIKDPERCKTGFWTYEHAKDAALAFRLAIEAEGLKKHEAFLISAEDNGTEFDSVELVKKYYSNNIPFKKEIKERQSLADWTKAKVLLGYQPRYTWSDIVKEKG